MENQKKPDEQPSTAAALVTLFIFAAVAYFSISMIYSYMTGPSKLFLQQYAETIELLDEEHLRWFTNMPEDIQRRTHEMPIDQREYHIYLWNFARISLCKHGSYTDWDEGRLYGFKRCFTKSEAAIGLNELDRMTRP